MKTVDIKEVKQRIREFAEAVDKAHKDFENFNCFNKETECRFTPAILNREEMEDWIEKNNKIPERRKITEKDFIPIRNGIEFVMAFDFFANIAPLQQDQ